MWLCLLLYCCVEILATSSHFASFPASPSSNRSAMARVPQSNYRSMPNRRGHERDLMVVLPVMQGDPVRGDSNLQHLYTKAPITRIIGENSQQTRDSSARSTTSKTIERRIDLAAFETNAPSSSKRLQNRQDRHPAVDVSMADKTATPKSYKLPLDYGYPDSFKFVQELNELPKNHKPDWASSEQVESTDRKSSVAASSTSHTQPPSTKNDPFQMFESVKPLEINKLLSLKQSAIGVTDSLPEENTTQPKKKHQESTKRPPTKRPLKKPQKSKPNGYKVAGFGQVPIVIDLGTTWRPPTSVFATDATSRFDPIAPQYSTLFETTKLFLPTPYTMPIENPTTKTITMTSTVASTTASPSTTTQSAESTTSTAVTTVNVTTLAPNFEWTNVTVAAGLTTSNSMLKSAVAEVKPSDLVSLNKLLGADDVKTSTSGPLRDITTKHPFPNDMLTNDMKNMLIALGILRAENNEPIFAVPTPSTSTTKNVLAMLATQKSMPTIDPYSYISFKKIPDKSSVSDDMRDFLASFGLIPKQMTSNRGGFRQQRRLENSSMPKTRTVRNSHVFRPVAELSHINSYDERKARKVNDAIDTIRKLSSIKNDTGNLSIELLEKQLENVTASLRETDDNDESARTANRTESGDGVAANSTTTAAPTTPVSTSTVNKTIPVRHQKSNYKLSAIIEIAKPVKNFNAVVLTTPSKILSSNQLSSMMKVINGMTRESYKSSTSSPSIADSYRVESSKVSKLGRQMAPAARPIGAHLHVDSNRYLYVKV